MPVDANPGDVESALKPLWLCAQAGDEVAYRQCLGLLATRLRKLEGLSVAEAAQRTGATVSAIKVQVHRGLRRLAALVRQDG